MATNNNRCIELDIIKFWAIILVVLGHVAVFYSTSPLFKPLIGSDFMAACQRIIYSFHMPLFIFVSGCVYGFQLECLKRKQNAKTFFIKKWKRLMIPYIIFGLFYVAPFLVLWGYRGNYFSYVYDGIILSHDARHLWYVWALFNIFIIFYAISKLIDHFNWPQYILLIFAIGCLIIANKIPYVFQISSAFKFMLWFILGYLMVVYKEKCFLSHFNKWGGYFGMVIFAIQIFLPSLSFLGRQTIYSFGGIAFFYSLSCNLKNIAEWSLFKLVVKDSYGVYLFHPILIYLMFHYWGHENISPILLSTIIFFISFMVSLLLTELTRRYRLGFIIGEK